MVGVPIKSGLSHRSRCRAVDSISDRSPLQAIRQAARQSAADETCEYRDQVFARLSASDVDQGRLNSFISH